MIASGRARGHLTIVHGGGGTASGNQGSMPGDGAPVVRVPLTPGEWALAAPLEPAWLAAPQLMRDWIRRLPSRLRPPAGQRFWITTAAPGLLDPRLGPAVLWHSARGTALYCAEGEITAQAAHLMGEVIEVSAHLVKPGMLPGLHVEVTRERDERLRTSHFPAVALAGPGGLRLRICADAVTEQMAETLADLGAAYAEHLAREVVPAMVWPGIRAQ